MKSNRLANMRRSSFLYGVSFFFRLKLLRSAHPLRLGWAGGFSSCGVVQIFKKDTMCE